MIKKTMVFFANRKERKKGKLREKNDRLRKAGKKVNKGWGMVNSGPGGKASGSAIDTTYFVGEEQKRVAEETVKEASNETEKN